VILVDNKNNTNPYINAALEEYLVRNADTSEHDYLLLYVNEPCVVLGKNQSLYKELNFNFLREERAKIVRRISGGGTVFHDSGNLCFAFISKFEEKKINNYAYFNQPIIHALKQMGVNATFNKRNDIVLNGKKISGNAQFTNRKNIISHGTLLFNANLENLRGALKENSFTVESNAVSSVKSSVMNLNEVLELNFEEFKNQLLTSLNSSGKLQLDSTAWNEINQLAEEKFNSFDWIYGRSPLTKIHKEKLTITVEKGDILSLEIKDPDFSFLEKIIGCQYSFLSIKKRLQELNTTAYSLSELTEIIF
jgi:lipoate-protein ligase A